jgi:hypothetical protein
MKRRLTWGERMIQWIGVAIAILGFLWNGVKDYQKGEIKIPQLPPTKQLTKVVYPVQYCLMAYDPNLDKVFYLHENGIWYDYAPQQRRYEATPQVRQVQGQNQAALGNVNGSQRRSSGYVYGQQAQASTNTTRY